MVVLLFNSMSVRVAIVLVLRRGLNTQVYPRVQAAVSHDGRAGGSLRLASQEVQ